jgi:co-chaperonin GroES (HSP10)
MKTVAEVAEAELENGGLVVNDRRTQYELSSSAEVATEKENKYPVPEYTSFTPILDRILVMRVPLDPNHEILEDGSVRDKRTKFIIPAKYRQHSNTGIVLAVGNFVVMGGQRIDLDEIVKPGDRVTFGDYNSEVFPMEKEKVLAMCDALKINYHEDEQGLRIVRIQDVRGIETPINESQEIDVQRVSYLAMDMLPKEVVNE